MGRAGAGSPGAEYYATLGVPATASANEIAHAFRTHAKALHPDLNPSPGAAEEFRRVAEAHEVLSDPVRRAAYDRARASAAATPPSWGSSPFSSAPSTDEKRSGPPP